MSSEEINCPGGPPSSSGVMPYVLPYVKLINDLNATIVRMQNEMDRLKQKLEESSNHRLPETPVATSSSSSMVDLSSADVPSSNLGLRDIFLPSVRQEKSKRHQAPLKHANPDSIEPNQVTPQMAKRTRSQSVSTERMSEVNTSDNASHKCLGCNDNTEKHTPRANKKQKLDVLSFAPLASTSSSSLVDLSSAKVPVHQEIGSRHQVHLKQPNPDLLLESNQTKSQMTRRNRSNSVGNADIERISQVITSDNVPDKWLGNYNSKEKYTPRAKPVSVKRKSESITSDYVQLKGTKNSNLEEKQNKIQKTEKQPKNYNKKQKFDNISNHNLPEIATKEMKYPPVVQVAASSVVDLNMAELLAQQGIKIRRRGAPRKQPNPDLLESNQSKPQITRRTRSKSVDAERTLEANTRINVSDQCLRSYNPKEKHIPIAKPGSLIFEVPVQEADIKIRKRGAPRKKPNPDSLGSNQSKPQITRRTRSKSVGAEKMEVNMSNSVSDQCLRTHNLKEKHIPIAKSVSITSDNLYFKGTENYGLEKNKNKKKMSTKELKNLKEKQKSDDMSNLHVPEITTRELNVLQFTPMDSASSSSMIDSSSAELLVHKEIENKSNRLQTPLKHANLDSLESNHITPQMTRRNRSQSVCIESISDVIRSDTVSNKSIGSYDPKEKHLPSSKPVSLDIMVEKIPKNIQSLDVGPKDLEVPNFTFKKLLPLYSVEGTEDMSDEVYIKRHLKMEHLEIQRKRWDMQRTRELNRIAHLKRSYNERQSLNSDKDELTTSLNDSENIGVIKVID